MSPAQIRLQDELRDAIDAVRGQTSRQRWAERALQAALASPPASAPLPQVEPAPPQVAPAPHPADPTTHPDALTQTHAHRYIGKLGRLRCATCGAPARS